ncbi:acyl-ACP--UDP-N-acetylglucosamine O-acyltransferase [Flavisolibacter tropicus]|uniref:Acyl-ACP--UDP-N-acetylglucosamine O-acyltransferase n=1 Tax=Flavisolibacter tropicus TaxID=1492898 RepID=A0A172TVS4_9BACT|nr:acyl-ACP--UDP-N-acetylglucosamine O-acyltransferase [Flavisolibacter tropicus]ANE51140.1 acyl-ACP--UDP-N- acetylglucosamine O-acyltransferase [Flavisolibacter tropicus]
MISPLASIHPNAQLGNNVTVEPFAVIHDNVVIGDGSHIMSHAVIMPFSRIGKECRIYPGAVIGAIPQDLKFIGEETSVEIGDYTTIRECVTVNRGTKDKWKTSVGSHCLLMAYVHIAHDCIVGNNVILANGVQLAGHVEVGDYAIIGGLAAANQFTRIGAHTYIGGQSAIRKDVPPFVKAAREPLSYAGINIVGLQRRNFKQEQIDIISRIYHLLFIGNHSTSTGIQRIVDELPDTELKSEILYFIQSSKIGVIKRFSKDGNED